MGVNSPVMRAQGGVAISMPSPVVVNGKPIVPALLGAIANTATVKVGPGHLRAAPHDSPRSSGNGAGATAGKWHRRWAVETLPDPSHYGGFYWLGDSEGIDGTANQPAATRLWAPDGASGPNWHSHYPYKPSVTAVNHYLFGGDIVTHPKGVNFNSHFIEHMWLDWGGSMPQPFTWLMAACLTGWDGGTNRHFLLDEGRNPRAGGLDAAAERRYWNGHKLSEDVGYRNMLAVSPTTVQLRTRQAGGQTGHVPSSHALHPKMYIGIFNGAKSAAGVYTPTLRRLRAVRLDTGKAHRYYVMGRAHGAVSQRASGNILVFEMRFFRGVLAEKDLRHHYAEMAALYHFSRYVRS